MALVAHFGAFLPTGGESLEGVGCRRVRSTRANCMKPQPAEFGSALRYDREGLDQALKLSPQEQVLAALGFLNLNPPSCKAST
jgi:hypothetical protein